MRTQAKKVIIAVVLGAVFAALTGLTALDMPTPESIRGMASDRTVEECGDPYRFGFPVSGGADYRGPCAPYEGMSVTAAVIIDFLIWAAVMYLVVSLAHRLLKEKHTHQPLPHA